jgi:hypothetical protein
VESYALLVNDVELILGILSFCRIAVGSWNVAGMLPPDDIDLREWLDTSEPADIYVIGWVFRSDFCIPGFMSCLPVWMYSVLPSSWSLLK